MKKIITICFGIITILGSVWSMILLAGSDSADMLFYLVGATVLGLICLTLIAFWIGVLIIFIGLVKQTILTGQGINFLVSSFFKKALDK
jgi:hypothetical protein